MEGRATRPSTHLAVHFGYLPHITDVTETKSVLTKQFNPPPYEARIRQELEVFREGSQGPLEAGNRTCSSFAVLIDDVGLPGPGGWATVFARQRPCGEFSDPPVRVRGSWQQSGARRHYL